MTEAMTSREIVAATLDTTGPERVARSFSPSDLVSAYTTAPVQQDHASATFVTYGLRSRYR
jgi:hypothetical protein